MSASPEQREPSRPARRRVRSAGAAKRRGTGDTVKLTAVATAALNLRLTAVAAHERVTKPEMMLRLIDQGLARYDLDAAIRAATGQDVAAA